MIGSRLNIQQQIGDKVPVINPIEQRQLIWCGHVRRMEEERGPKEFSAIEEGLG